ncbi:outer membrane beta-barrel protein [Methylocystis iwaonis]|uniref:outer membrane beta-barrel protein n=1 Tax=Methylocystis iwaonis TaxID=2885079 RepID=UPI002E7AD59A|nr:outer membrane beta-barrel protein [Methylocystis iwaonis]
MAALCAALAVAAAAPAHGQALPQPKASAPLSTLAGQDKPPLRRLDSPGSAVAPQAGSLGLGQTPGLSAGANYGAPVKRQKLPKPYPPRRAPYPPPFSPKTPLPALEPYKSSYLAKQRALRLRSTYAPPGQHLLAPAPPPVTVAAEPTIKAKGKPKVEMNPYDPLGVAVGSTLLFPFVQTSGGYDDNPNRLSASYNPRGSTLFRGEGGLRVKSDWSRHSLEGELRGGYSEYFDYPTASRADAQGAMTARYDLTTDTALDLRGRLQLDTQRPGAPAISADQSSVYVVNRPIILGVGTQGGVTQKFSRIEVSLRGTYDRVWYQDAQYSNGTTLNLASTSYNDFGALLRTSYEVTPDLKPFVEGTLDKRIHDSPVDPYGFYRDSTGYTIRGGATFNVTEMVKGEISGGYGQRNYADFRLAELRGPVIDAALIYTPSALTTLTLRGSTTMNETTLAYASGVLTRSITATLSHDLMRNLNITFTGNYFTNDYQSSDSPIVVAAAVASGASLNVRERGGSAAVRLEYKLTRSITLRGSFTHEQLSSSFRNAGYSANVYLLGLRFQL